MRKVKEMVEFSKWHGNFQLKGSISFQEFKFLIEKIDKMNSIPNHLNDEEYWDHIVVIESLRRDRFNIFKRFMNKLNKES